MLLVSIKLASGLTLYGLLGPNKEMQMSPPEFYDDDDGRGGMVIVALLVAAIIGMIFGMVTLAAFI